MINAESSEKWRICIDSNMYKIDDITKIYMKCMKINRWKNHGRLSRDGKKREIYHIIDLLKYDLFYKQEIYDTILESCSILK